MIDFNGLFYPGNDNKLIVSLCYLIIFLISYKRFDTLIMNYGTYDAPDTARPWTTWIRYHAAAAVYASVYAIFFALLYQLFHRHPVLIDTAISFLGKNSRIGKMLTDLGQNMALIGPILALVLLTLVAEKYRKVAAYDKKLRYYFQRLGSIPGAISLTIRKLKKYELKVGMGECIDNLPDDMKTEVLQPMFQEDRKSLEHLYLRACHLFHQIENWNSMSSDFFLFKRAYYQSFENIKIRFDKLNRNAKRYYQLKLNFFAETPLGPQLPSNGSKSGFDQMYPKVLTELRKDLKHDLKYILENLYIFISCAVHNKGITARTRKKLLRSFGFNITRENRLGRNGVDPNDVTILSMFLVFVIPLSAIFAKFAGDATIGGIKSTTYVVWSAMTIFVGVAAVGSAIFVKRVRASSENRFWRFIKPYHGRPWCAYLISGMIAGIMGVAAIFLLGSLMSEGGEWTMKRLARTIPWGLVPMNIAMAIGYQLDRKKTAGQHTMAMEALVTGLIAVLGAVAALVINSGSVDMAELIPKMRFSLPAAALLGGGIGAIYPNRFRRQVRRRVQFSPAQVNLKEIISGCKNKFIERSEKVDVELIVDADSNFPIIHADQKKLEFAINGLISNALEFTPGKGEIRISTAAHNGDGIRICVADSGIGMSEYNMKTIIDASEEIVHSAWEQVGEYGDADLIQVRSIAEKHGGTLDLDSDQWKGTTVTVTLPLKEGYKHAPQGEPESPVQDAQATLAA